MNYPKQKREKQEAHTSVSHTIRFPTALYERLHAIAEQQNRSFNGQVVFMLREAMPSDYTITINPPYTITASETSTDA